MKNASSSILKQHFNFSREKTNIVDDDEGENESRLIIVAKSLPLNIKKSKNLEKKWNIEWNDARDFLSSIRVLQRVKDLVFVGIPSIHIDEDDHELFEEQLEKFCETNGIASEDDKLQFKVHCQPVYLDTETKNLFFKVFCKRILWPTLHYVLPHRNESWALDWNGSWQAYQKVNLEYSRVAASCAESARDIVWIHNYHLFLMPTFIRKKLPNARVGYFMHTPFPSSDCFRVLPSGKEILQSLLTADLIGFHTFDYVRYFLSCCKRILELDFETMPGGRMGIKFNGRMVSVIISHCGIDSEFFKQRALNRDIIEKANVIQERYKHRKIITTGIDDLDVVKGPILKFQAYRTFLENNERWHDKVVLVAIVSPGSSNKEDRDFVYASLWKEINIIKAQFGDSVIAIEEKCATLDDIIAMNVASDVGFISTFWDGLNVAPYEYTACRTTEKPGVLILSEFMGCSRALSGVLRVNPWNLNEVSNTIYQALTLPMKDRQLYHERRYPYVMQHTSEHWGVHFLKNIEEASKLIVDLNILSVGFGSGVRLIGLRPDFCHLDQPQLINSYRNCTERIILCDYDGTLIDNKDRGQHGPSPEVLIALQKLCTDSSSTIFVVSGRPRSELQKWFSRLDNLGLAAEKGAFLRWPSRLRNRISCMKTEKKGGDDWEIICSSTDSSWKIVALGIMNQYKEHTAGSWIEDKEVSIVWHYESADPEFGRMQARELEKILIGVIDQQLIEIIVYEYNRIVEVKPQGIGKGVTATHIMKKVLQLPCKTNPKSLQSISSLSLSESSSASFSPSLSPSSLPSLQSLEGTSDISSRIETRSAPESILVTTATTIASKLTQLLSISPTPKTITTSSSPLSSLLSTTTTTTITVTTTTTTTTITTPTTPTTTPATTTTTTTTTISTSTKLKTNMKEPFLLCLGDDRSDEEMFLALLNRADLGVDARKILLKELRQSKDASNKKKKRVPSKSVDKKRSQHTFTCCVGLKPGSNAQYYVQSHEEVIDLLGALADCHKSGRDEMNNSLRHSYPFHSSLSGDNFDLGDSIARGSINLYK